ncbi:MAG: glycosyl transferase [Afipia sp.]|nr:glycosyl transferase [Afipia sp.]
MISVVIPTEGVEQPVVATLAALVPGAAAGIIQRVVLVDRPGSDTIERVADVAGCDFLRFEGSRAAALAKGAEQSRSPWLLFLRPGAVLESSWIDETTQFMERMSASGQRRAGIFRYARSPYEEATVRDGVRLLARLISGPSADQGLLISRDHYERIGGYAPQVRRAEAKLISKLGRTGRAMLRTRIFVAA